MLATFKAICYLCTVNKSITQKKINHDNNKRRFNEDSRHRRNRN